MDSNIFLTNIANLNYMKIGLLTVGTEILLGDTVNTNLSKLGSILYNSGFYLNKEITVSDERSEI